MTPEEKMDLALSKVLSEYINNDQVPPQNAISILLSNSFDIAQAFGEDYLTYLIVAMLTSHQNLNRAKTAIQHYIDQGYNTARTLH